MSKFKCDILSDLKEHFSVFTQFFLISQSNFLGENHKKIDDPGKKRYEKKCIIWSTDKNGGVSVS